MATTVKEWGGNDFNFIFYLIKGSDNVHIHIGTLQTSLYQLKLEREGYYKLCPQQFLSFGNFKAKLFEIFLFN